MTHRIAVFLVAALALAACDNDPGKDKAHAAASAPAATTESAAASAKTVAHYAFSNDGSKIEFTGAKVTGKHDGAFESFTGKIDVGDGDATKGAVNAEIDMDKIKTEDEQLTGHLKSKDFFEVAKYPKATFASTSIKAGGEKGATHTITGNLTIRGVTKSVSFPATIKITGDGVDVASEFTINRQDFGVTYPGHADDLIKDQFALRLSLHAKKS